MHASPGRKHFPYLSRLAQLMRAALATLPPDALERHADAVRAFQCADGAFRGRRGEGDLYYTAFAVRALHAADPSCDLAPLEPWLRAQKPRTVIETLNLLDTLHLLGAAPREPERILESLEAFRTAEACYAKQPGEDEGSLYHTFLAVLSYDLLGERPPRAAQLGRSVLEFRRDDGGFAELLGQAHGSTNPTAAGVALLDLLDIRDDAARAGAARFLLARQAPSGGWFATRSAPLADLLSTYTALLSLLALGAIGRDKLVEALRFVRRCEGPQGGFCAAPEDLGVDAEYTYYGLGVLALAGMAAAGSAPLGQPLPS